MLHLHQTNDHNILLNAFFETIVDHPLENPLKKEYVIVQTPGMKTWITLKATERHGIFAQTEFLNITEFLTKLQFLLTEKHEEKSVYTKSVLKWAIFRILSENIDHPDFTIIKEYLGEKNTDREQNQSKLFGLSVKIADLFDQYMIYRADMLQKWKQNTLTLPKHPHEKWQMQLWKRIQEVFPNNESRADTIQNLAHSISQDESKISTYVSRLSLFGMSVLPPFYIEALQKLAEKIEVHFFLINPSPQIYWGDGLSDKKQAQLQKKVLNDNTTNPEELFSDTLNSFLRNLGGAGAEFLDLIYDTDFQEHSLEVKNFSQDTLLHHIQNQILNAEEPHKRTTIQETDSSLQIEICHSPRREVEVLFDRLLDAFEQDESLTPSDVLIILPDLKTYTPYIDMVFTSDKNKRAVIPYTISDRSFMHLNPTANTLQMLLKLFTERFQASKLLSIFEELVTYQSIKIPPEHLEWIRQKVKDAGIRWGWDKEFKKKLNLPENDLFSWKKGISRMLLGYALEQDDKATLYQEELPLEDMEGGIMDSIGIFLSLLDAIKDFYTQSLEKHTLKEWNTLLKNLLIQIFHIQNSNQTEDSPQDTLSEGLLQIFKTLDQISEDSTLANYSPRISYFLFQTIVLSELEDLPSENHFLKGKITFASMVPMRSIPFKIIGILGLNQGAFPRRDPQYLFNLMIAQPRKGDRSLNKGDRYLFLDLVMSASQKLILSYVGKSLKDNSVMPPSTLIQFLLDYLDRFFESPSDKPVSKVIQTEHPLHPFSTRYGQSPKLFTYQKHWFEKVQAKPPIHPFYWEKVSPEWDPQVVDGNLIESCLKDPPKNFLKITENIYLPDPKDSDADSEPFEINTLVTYQLRKAYLKTELSKDQKIYKQTIKKLEASGELPAGILKDFKTQQAQAEAKSILQRIQNEWFQETPLPQSEDFIFEKEIDSLTFRFSRKNIIRTPEGDMILIEPASLKGKHTLSAWIAHLFFNLERKTHTVLVTKDEDEKVQSFTPLQSNEAKEILLTLHQFTKEMLSHPIPFDPDASLEYIKKSQQKSKKSPLQAALDKLFQDQNYSTKQQKGFEHEFFYSDKETFPTEEFIKWTDQLLADLQTHLEQSS